MLLIGLFSTVLITKERTFVVMVLPHHEPETVAVLDRKRPLHDHLNEFIIVLVCIEFTVKWFAKIPQC